MGFSFTEKLRADSNYYSLIVIIRLRKSCIKWKAMTALQKLIMEHFHGNVMRIESLAFHKLITAMVFTASVLRRINVVINLRPTQLPPIILWLVKTVLLPTLNIKFVWFFPDIHLLWHDAQGKMLIQHAIIICCFTTALIPRSDQHRDWHTLHHRVLHSKCQCRKHNLVLTRLSKSLFKLLQQTLTLMCKT